ncbi:MAG: response regulator [Nitrospirae bacterium]|nr:response regulator [Nitrospirota bacterium]
MKSKILIVEDNPKNRKLMADILRHYSFDVIEAEDGAKGIEAAKKHIPDLIFMDIQMPGISGFEAIKALKESMETKHIKIIAVTSFAMSGDKEKILAAGADGYISKPIDTRELPKIAKENMPDING